MPQPESDALAFDTAAIPLPLKLLWPTIKSVAVQLLLRTASDRLAREAAKFLRRELGPAERAAARAMLEQLTQEDF